MEKLIHIDDEGIIVEGLLIVPDGATSVILFAHGSGSSRFSPRNNYVADILNDAGMGTLLVDLLSRDEDQNYQTRFNIPLLTKRLTKIIDWLKHDHMTKRLSIGLFGASTGAAAALEAAALPGSTVKAVVSRGGRPDLAMNVLDRVQAPTLLIVGGEDHQVIELNKEAFDCLTCTKRLDIIPHATHLFEELGCLEEVADHAKRWFLHHLYTEERLKF